MKLFYFSSLCLLIAITILLTRCKKEAEPKPATPNSPIETKAVTVYPDGGVTLNGVINQVPANLTEYGFLVSTDSLFRNPQRFRVTDPAAPGTFKTDVNAGLQKNTIYYCTTYSVVNNGISLTIYNSVRFNSSGSKKIVTTSVAPLKADIGDTITIKGKYFSNQSFVNVKFGNQFAITTVLSDSVMKCIVPATVDQPAPLVTISYSGMLDTATDKFSLNAPVLSNFTTVATFRDTVIINGDHFGYQNSLNQVSFDAVAATVISSSRKQLKVVVPDNIAKSLTTINVKAQLQTVSSITKFQIRQPVITSVTPSGNINDPVIVKGKYFHPVITDNTIYSENNLAQLTGGNTTQLTYNIPNGPYPRRKATVKLKLLDYVVSYTPDMAISDKWIPVGTVPFNDTDIPGAFTINNVSYVVAGSQNFQDSRMYVWKFNTSDFSWQQITAPNNITYGKVVATATKAYMYIPTTTSISNFYEYDPANNTWTARANYPAAVRQSGTMFTIGNKVYFGLGSSTPYYGGTPTADDTFYEYDPATNSWRTIADYPDPQYYGARLGASAFVINNLGYVGCGATNTGMFAFFAYSPATNSWTRVHDFPGAWSYTASFSFGNYGYIATGESIAGTASHDYFKYDPAVDTWTHLADYVGCNACGWGFERAYTFVNNGFVYIGGGNSSSSNYQLLQAAASGL
jgi:hypothetical protein